MTMRFLPPLFALLPVAPLPALPVNLAAAGTAAGSSQGYGSVVADGSDGNRDGNFANGSVFHTVIPDTSPYWEVDLGAMRYLDRVMIWPRTDAVQGTVTKLRIKVLDAANTVLWQQTFLPASSVANPWGTVALRGVQGRKVRLERTDNPASPNFLTFAECEVWASPNPIPPNLAAGMPTTASGKGGHSTPLEAGNDGEISGDYNLPGHPIFHTPGAGVGQFWEVDLGNGLPVDQDVDHLHIFNRTDFSNLDNVRVTLKNAAGAAVWTGDINITRNTIINGGRQYDVVVDVPGVVPARYCRLETLTNSALSFAEVEVFGPAQDITAPFVTGTDPPDAELVAEFFRTEVQFSEAVAGIDAGDLRINGTLATGISALSASRFAFTFTQPASGTVTLSWAAGHGIADAAGNPFAGSAWFVTLDTSLPAPAPFISEFLADNRGGLKDEEDDSPDWIEITNPGPTAVNLADWFLSDSPSLLTKWRFPSLTIPAGGSALVFASAKDRAVAGAPLHTNFKLDPDGDSIFLTKPDGVTIADQIVNFPPQQAGISFGVGRNLSAAALVAPGAAAKFFIPTAAVAGWTARSGFDDSGWAAAVSGIGFDQSGGLTGAGPLGLWTFNDASVPSTAVDATGRGNNGTVTTAVYTADAGGRSGLPGDRAMSFAGNGVVSFPGAAAGTFDSITPRNAVAISLWIFGATTQPSPDFLFFAGSESNGTGIRVFDAHLPWSDSVIYWDTAGCCDPARQRVTVGEPDQSKWKGAWNHYVLQKNGDRKEIWQNGALIFSGTSTDPMMNFRSLYLGASSGAAASGYHGLIDDFAVFEGGMQPGQIQNLAAGASPLAVRSLAPLISTDISSAMRGVNASALVRIPFTVPDPSGLDLLVLRMRYEDGFVAWLNGTEIARRNAPAGAIPAFGAAAVSPRPSGAALEPEEIDVSRYASLLQAGTNVLAIQGLNASAADADFLLLPELLAGQRLAGRFFPHPTPGAMNGAGYTGFVADTRIQPGRGFYDAPQTVTISCATPGVTVIYTTDGTIPSVTNGVAGLSPATLQVSATTTLRATAVGASPELAPANVDTHTYLFVDQVKDQQRPATAPVTWPGNFPGDYTMDSRVVNSTLPGYSLREALLAIPSLSITTEPAGLWGANGIYAQSAGRGDAYERAASGEWMDPSGADGFHVNFGLAIHGNISRNKDFTPKHGFKMYFKSDFGDSKLRHDLFPGSQIREFDQLILRAGSTDTFPCTEWGPVGIGPGGAAVQRWARAWASYLRDQWVRDTQLAMGHPSAHGRYCHLYLNGTYWGLYNICEHPDEDFMSSHIGGSPPQWDVLVDFAELKSGNYTAWNQLQALASGTANDAVFQQMLGNNPDGSRNPAYPILLNADSLIDYMILHIFIGADDWPNHNWWAGRATRSDSVDGFRFFAWDQEISNENPAYERSSWQSSPARYADVSAANTPASIFFALRRDSPEFRLRFADRVQKFLFNGGALSQAANVARWNARAAEIDRAIVAESARWGDHRPNLLHPGDPYKREVDWLAHLNWMASNYWPLIPTAALQRFRDADHYPALYPAVSAPVLNQHGGDYPPGFLAQLSHSNGSGAIYYTTNGADPRSPGVPVYTAPIALSGTQTIKARVLQNSTWSALLEAVFVPDPDLDDDRIPNDWEAAYNLDPNNPTDAGLDPDGDGASSLDEYAAGTHPRDGASRFIAASSVTADTLYITFTAKAGRAYRLEASDSLGTWQTVDTRSAGPVDAAAEFAIPIAEARRFFRVVAAVDP